MVRDSVAEAWERDAARAHSALSDEVRRRRAAEVRVEALEATVAALEMECAVWRARSEEADARARLDWLRRVA